MKNGGYNFVIRRVEALCPGFKVIAGPFWVEACKDKVRRDERRQCCAALANLQLAQVSAKVVMMGVRAFVVRTAEGWHACDKLEERRRTCETGAKLRGGRGQ